MNREELLDKEHPSIYSLQKLVEVAHYNIDRIKFIWQKMWNIIREHMSTVAITAPSDVSLFAVDSLKQLSVKFLLVS